MIVVLSSILSFFVGVVLGVLFGWTASFWLIALGLSFLFARRNWALIFLCFLCGLWRVDLYESQALEPELGWQELEGRVVEEIDRRVDHQKITVLTEHGRVLVKLNLYHEIEYGDRVLLKGELEEATDDVEGFDYAAYLARYRIWLVMYDPHLELLEKAEPSFRGVLYGFKGKVEGRINQVFHEPEASFAAGLLLGSRKGMPEELALAFQRVGLTHIVAISGYNISLVIAAMFLLLGFLPLKWRVVASSLAIFVFCLLVGASAAVVRSGIMGVLTLWALFSGRKSQVFFALLWSAVLMILMNPYTLVYDIGFQLSFASTFGLLVFVPILQRCTEWWTRALVLKEALLLTVAAQIATFPITAYNFGRFSLISPVANVLAAPFLPFAMLFSAFAVIAGKPMALLAWFHLRAVELIALLLAKLPYIDVAIPMTQEAYLISWMILLFSCCQFYKSILVRAFVQEPVEVISRVQSI